MLSIVNNFFMIKKKKYNKKLQKKYQKTYERKIQCISHI